MLDIRTIRENLEDVAARLKIKGFDLDIEKFQQLDKARSAALTAAQQLQAEKKKASKQIGQFIAQGLSVDDAKAKISEVLAEIDGKLNAEVEQAKSIQDAINTILMATPNLPDESVPFGKDEDDNVEIRLWGEPRKFDFEPKDHD